MYIYRCVCAYVDLLNRCLHYHTHAHIYIYMYIYIYVYIYIYCKSVCTHTHTHSHLATHRGSFRAGKIPAGTS